MLSACKGLTQRDGQKVQTYRFEHADLDYIFYLEQT